MLRNEYPSPSKVFTFVTQILLHDLYVENEKSGLDCKISFKF